MKTKTITVRMDAEHYGLLQDIQAQLSANMRGANVSITSAMAAAIQAGHTLFCNEDLRVLKREELDRFSEFVCGLVSQMVSRMTGKPVEVSREFGGAFLFEGEDMSMAFAGMDALLSEFQRSEREGQQAH